MRSSAIDMITNMSNTIRFHLKLKWNEIVEDDLKSKSVEQLERDEIERIQHFRNEELLCGYCLWRGCIAREYLSLYIVLPSYQLDQE